MRHKAKSKYAGEEVELIDEFHHDQYPDMESLVIEDWWDRISGGQSWRDAKGNPACIVYGIRTGLATYSVPFNDEVLYGKYKGMGVLVHINEINNQEQ